MGRRSYKESGLGSYSPMNYFLRRRESRLPPRRERKASAPTPAPVVGSVAVTTVPSLSFPLSSSVVTLKVYVPPSTPPSNSYSI